MKPHPKFPDSAICEGCELRFPITELHPDDDAAWWCGPCADMVIAYSDEMAAREAAAPSPARARRSGTRAYQ